MKLLVCDLGLTQQIFHENPDFCIYCQLQRLENIAQSPNDTIGFKTYALTNGLTCR